MPHGKYRPDHHLHDLHRHEGPQEHRGQRIQRAAPGRGPQGGGSARHGGEQHDAHVDGERTHDRPGAPVQHAHGCRCAACRRGNGLSAVLGHPAVDARVDVHRDQSQHQEGNDRGDGGQRQGQQGRAGDTGVHAQAAARGQRTHVVHALAHVGGHARQVLSAFCRVRTRQPRRMAPA
ncbi:hypothetical protein G6F23_014088 [Rhizopus arrhizus]|nr:hypothetical protein G6F23_014088 [Rhizopus arrhizus]